jgi:hypothetical protein
MIKHALSAILVTLLVGGVTCAEPADAAECSAGWGKKVVKLYAAPELGYPDACRSTVCHVGSHEAWRTQLLLYPPPTMMVVMWHYRASATSGIGLPACPADINAAAFSRP